MRQSHIDSYFGTVHLQPSTALADYDFLRSTYELLLRSPQPNVAAINAAFDALDAAHGRLKSAHVHLAKGLLLKAAH